MNPEVTAKRKRLTKDFVCLDCKTVEAPRNPKALGLIAVTLGGIIFVMSIIMMISAGLAGGATVVVSIVFVLLGAASLMRKAKCSACGSTRTVPVNSPAGKKIAPEI